jgi:methylated-DNA-[protein]-cysteine S-methyltransferase
MSDIRANHDTEGADGPDGSELVAALRATVPLPGDDALSGLRARLALDAEAQDLVDVAYRIVDSPFGSLLVAVTVDGLARLAFKHEDHDQVLEQLSVAISPRVLASPGRTATVARQLDEYFAGRRHHFDLAVDLRLASGFRRAVLDQLCLVDYGHTVSYAELARSAGSPRAVRAVGTACATNPVPVVVPCHRVVRSDGSVGQYRGGTEVKQALLNMEAAA